MFNREQIRGLRQQIRSLRQLPPRVALFRWRAERLARARNDEWALVSASHHDSLGRLLNLAKPYRQVAELGTATGWTSVALALDRRDRAVTTFDVEQRSHLLDYLALERRAARRIRRVLRPGREGALPVEFLFIDSSHERDETVAEFQAWEPHIQPGGMVVFHDYRNSMYPGVEQAINDDLLLSGEPVLDMFVWRKP